MKITITKNELENFMDVCREAQVINNCFSGKFMAAINSFSTEEFIKYISEGSAGKTPFTLSESNGNLIISIRATFTSKVIQMVSKYAGMIVPLYKSLISSYISSITDIEKLFDEEIELLEQEKKDKTLKEVNVNIGTKPDGHGGIYPKVFIKPFNDPSGICDNIRSAITGLEETVAKAEKVLEDSDEYDAGAACRFIEGIKTICAAKGIKDMKSINQIFLFIIRCSIYESIGLVCEPDDSIKSVAILVKDLFYSFDVIDRSIILEFINYHFEKENDSQSVKTTSNIEAVKEALNEIEENSKTICNDSAPVIQNDPLLFVQIDEVAAEREALIRRIKDCDKLLGNNPNHMTLQIDEDLSFILLGKGGDEALLNRIKENGDLIKALNKQVNDPSGLGKLLHGIK